VHARRRRTPLGIGLALAAALVTCDSLRRDELVCEEAVAKLRTCCPTFVAEAWSCQGGQDACGQSVSPDLGEAQASVVRSASCDELRLNGWCSASPPVPRRPAEAP
jgi:hypothetical protein